MALTDPLLDPVLVHPVGSAPGWPTRALALEAIEALEHPRTTVQLARLLRPTASTASRRATVPREAGPLGSLRRGNTALHRRPPLGDVLMDGALSAARAARGPRRR
ncbi:hypothetical protein [Streptomyces sp. NPDC058695]|uniref:hypothetical protein n=1 Tax=Streptomyces sp. NPDC058695 TaxID=3346604 RepID=UPI003668D486